ncbi:unnamed protein product [Hymenolepis diminuta]|uniref:Uncharacterized protein n=1 Tax=Hymenolepis diminuta TaxID=6216 RepID=A0A564YMD8_HYMDI|nr:unnamed protein product [Hymenolepis diminuta]
MLWRGLTQVTHIKLPLLSTQEQRTLASYRLFRFLFISSLPQRSPLFISLCHLNQMHCGFLEYIFGLLNSWCSASKLFLALTQTATNW